MCTVVGVYISIQIKIKIDKKFDLIIISSEYIFD
jgi:uncharacterized membrane protein